MLISLVSELSKEQALKKVKDGRIGSVTKAVRRNPELNRIENVLIIGKSRSIDHENGVGTLSDHITNKPFCRIAVDGTFTIDKDNQEEVEQAISVLETLGIDFFYQYRGQQVV